jgi:hypothetical protein
VSSITSPKVVVSPLENSVVVSPDTSVVTVTTLANNIVISDGGMQGASGGLRVYSFATAVSYAPAITNFDQINITALASNFTLLTPVGTPQDAQKLIVRIKDAGISKTLTFASGVGGYRAVGVVLPSFTVASLDLYVGCIYNAQDNFWDVIALVQQ